MVYIYILIVSMRWFLFCLYAHRRLDAKICCECEWRCFFVFTQSSCDVPNVNVKARCATICQNHMTNRQIRTKHEFSFLFSCSISLSHSLSVLVYVGILCISSLFNDRYIYIWHVGVRKTTQFIVDECHASKTEKILPSDRMCGQYICIFKNKTKNEWWIWDTKMWPLRKYGACRIFERYLILWYRIIFVYMCVHTWSENKARYILLLTPAHKQSWEKKTK